MQNSTPAHAMISECKNWRVLTLGQWNACEQDIEIEEGEWWYQEIRVVYIPEFHCFYPLTFQEKGSGQHHAEQ
jgi:hypothetical protein